MKYLFTIALAATLFISCNNETKTQSKAETLAPVAVEPETPAKTYPAAMTAIFDAHGGMKKWNDMNTMSYALPKEVEEIHTIDLKTRKVRIETKDYALGFDGDKVWLKQEDSTSFNPSRARFYHNLMFYFYAMPFVLADDGITYEETKSLEMDGVTYPGTKISFGEGVGDAPDDNYIIYHHPETKEMAWLAYTVTYNSKEPSERYSYIKYAEWENVNGVKLPSKLQWYKVEDGKPTEMRSERAFTKTSLSEAKADTALFSKPEGGEFTE